MDTSRDEINYLTMHFGSLQVSPKQMAKLNQRPTTLFVPDTDTSASSGYQVLLTGYAEHIRDIEVASDQGRFLITLLNSLRSTPRSADAFQKKGKYQYLLSKE